MYTVCGEAIGCGYLFKDFETLEEALEYFEKIVSYWCEPEIWHKGKKIKD